jgi:hypothetical protein
VCGIDERDERGGAVETEPGFLVVRAAAGSGEVVDDRLDLFVCAVRERCETAWEQVQHVAGYGVVESRDTAREHVAYDFGRGHRRVGPRNHFVE